MAAYVWGLLHVGGAVLEVEDDGVGSSPILAGRDDEPAAHAVDVTPAALGLALAAAGLAVASGYVSEVRLRAAACAGGGVRP